MSPRLPRTPQEMGLSPDTMFFDPESTVNRAIDAGSGLEVSGITPYQAIPEPQLDLKSMLETVAAIKQAVEVLLGVRGSREQSAAKVGDLPAMLESLRMFLEDTRTLAAVTTIADNTFEITAADSPYTVTSAYATVHVDASAGNVTVNLFPSDKGVFCRVVRGDSSANTVTIASADNINGDPSVDILPEEVFDIFGSTSNGYRL